MKGVGCLVVLLVAALIYAAWQVVATIYPFVFLLLAIPLFWHDRGLSAAVAVFSGLAVYFSQWPTGLVRFQKTDVESGLILAIAVACVGLYLKRYDKDERVWNSRTYVLAYAAFITAVWLYSIVAFGFLLFWGAELAYQR
jgi:hypothetical protein